MPKLYRLLLIISPFIFTHCSTGVNPRGISTQKILLTDWAFKQTDQDSTFFRPATVPGSILPDLIKFGDIPDPFHDDHEKDLEWIGKTDWQYKNEFTLSSGQKQNKYINLIFEGLDTYAEVFLNDHKILRAENMFVQHQIPVKSYLKEGPNELIVNFYSTVNQDSIKQANHPFLYPDSRSFTRKAPYQYGWDWGPRLIDMGIWRPVYLEFIEEFKLEQVHVVTDSVVANRAYTSILLNIEAMDSCRLDILGNIESARQKTFDTQINLYPGAQRISIPLVIENPKLWWPNGMGDPFLYELDLSISSGKQSMDTLIRFGVREVNLIQEKDDSGTSFYFKVNDQALFIRGSNYIPQHSFPSRTSKEDQNRLLNDAAEVGMNMLRVWGGGIYPDDEFYDLCDSLGLLVWQDFMFACNFYPADEHFLNNLKQEISQQVERLDGRTSLALWCGNNEIDEAWHNWGYQEALNYSWENQAEIWSDYQTIFDTLIPGIIDENGLGTDYIPTSPKIGWGNEEALHEGDMHYWGVWWGEEAFEKYRQKTGRFMSEYGFQSFPSIALMNRYFYRDSLVLEAPTLLSHQKHPRGMELISKYMQRDYSSPSDPEEYAYVSQLLQRRGMRIAIEAHRLKKPYCMGTLYWQLNDCWPAISWSSIDFEGYWKAFHHDLLHLYANQLLVFEEGKAEYKVYLINEDAGLDRCSVQLKIVDFEGNIYFDSTAAFPSPCTYNPMIFSIDKKELANYAPMQNLFFQWSILDKNRTLSSHRYFPSKPSELRLENTDLDVKYSFDNTNHFLDLYSNRLIKDLYLYSEDKSLRFVENYFDLLGKKRIQIRNGTDNPADSLLKDLRFFSLNPSVKLVWVE